MVSLLCLVGQLPMYAHFACSHSQSKMEHITKPYALGSFGIQVNCPRKHLMVSREVNSCFMRPMKACSI
jgi:hypothetical protein